MLSIKVASASGEVGATAEYSQSGLPDENQGARTLAMLEKGDVGVIRYTYCMPVKPVTTMKQKMKEWKGASPLRMRVSEEGS
jgi:hypothetical protein